MINEDKILNRFKECKNGNQVARELNVSKHMVYSILSKHGNLSFMKNKPSDDTINEIRLLYQSYVPVRVIAEKYKLSAKHIVFILQAAGIQPKRTASTIFNKQYFSKIDTERKAYWVGLLYADGCVNLKRAYLEITLKDKDILKEFANDLGLGDDHVKQKRVLLNGKEFINYRLGVCSKQIVEDLIHVGCLEKKSLILDFPTYDQIPKNLIRHFIRGYYDGDGVCRKNGDYKGFLGTEIFLSKLKEILREDVGIKGRMSIIKQKGNYYQMRLALKDTRNILDPYMYDNATIYLKRKR